MVRTNIDLISKSYILFAVISYWAHIITKKTKSRSMIKDMKGVASHCFCICVVTVGFWGGKRWPFPINPHSPQYQPQLHHSSLTAASTTPVPSSHSTRLLLLFFSFSLLSFLLSVFSLLFSLLHPTHLPRRHCLAWNISCLDWVLLLWSTFPN